MKITHTHTHTAFTFLVTLILLFSTPPLFAQMSCGLDHPENFKGDETAGSEKMALCDLDPFGSEITTKTISLTFHVFQKDDGTGNIQEADAWSKIDYRIVNAANQHFQTLQPMALSSPSLYFQDAKVRFQVEANYFWQNSMLHGLTRNSENDGEAMYEYIINRPEVANKFNTIHVFVPGPDSSDPTSLVGRASNIGEQAFSDYEYWTLLQNVSSADANGQSNGIAALLRHEIGHNLGLWHSWNEGFGQFNPQLPDTPTSSSSFNSGSNNMMDYNPHQIALTVDQFTRVHRFLFDHPEIIASGHQAPATGLILSDPVTGNPFSSNTIGFNATNGAVQIDNVVSNHGQINWTVEAKSYQYNTGVNIQTGGERLNFFNLGWMNLRADWTEKCAVLSDNLSVFGTVNYRAVQNSGDPDYVNIQADAEPKQGATGDKSSKYLSDQIFDPVVSVLFTDVKGVYVTFNNLGEQDQTNLRFNWAMLNPGIIFGTIITRSGRQISIKTLKH